MLSTVILCFQCACFFLSFPTYDNSLIFMIQAALSGETFVVFPFVQKKCFNMKI